MSKFYHYCKKLAAKLLQLVPPLFSIFLLIFSHSARADVSDLSCCGVSSRFVEEANRAIHKVENAVNDSVSQYVSLFNFDMGSQKFGVNGNASLGRITTPSFDCHAPKQVLHSGIADFGIKPRYLISAKLFGQDINVVDASMQGAQGKGAVSPGVNPGQRDSGIRLSVKIMGIEVINKSRKGPVIAAKNPKVPHPADLLGADQKTGTGGKLIDISRSISESAGGQAIKIPIIPGLFIEFDAGFYLQTNLTFTYGVRSALLSISGGGSASSKFGKNPANATDDYCEAAPDDDFNYNFPSSATSTTPINTPVCAMKSSALPKKGPAFYSDLGSRVMSQADRFQGLRQQIRDIKVKEFLDDAKLAANGLGENFSKIADPGTSIGEKCSMLGAGDIQSQVRPFTNDLAKLQTTYDNARGLITESTRLYQDIQSMLNVSENGFPEVSATAGIALDGRVGGWAAAVLALDFAVAKGWVGVRGYLTLIDIRVGLGATLSTKSQYLDLTSNLQQVLLSGGIDAVWGVKVGVDSFAVTFDGSYNLFTFPGYRSQNEWLVGRLDFRALNASNPKPPLFWCVNLFGNSVDPERCTDGNLANAVVIPGLAAHQEFREKYFGERSMTETPSCVISDGGKPFYTSSQVADCALPADSDTALSADARGNPHPISAYFKDHPEAFITNLRNSSNKPVKVFSADQATGTPNVKVYTATSGINAPTVQVVQNQGYNQLVFNETPSAEAAVTEAPLAKKVLTVASRTQFIDQADASGVITSVPASSTDPRLMIDLNWVTSSQWASNGWTSPSSSQNTRIFTGDIGALSNELILEMAKNFKLGRCGARDTFSEIYLSLSGVPYPLTGDTEGKASVNATELKDSPCSIGNSTTLGQRDFAACVLREALAKGECFPSSRAVNLVRMANLSNADVIAYFLAPSAPAKKISGTFYAHNSYGTEQYLEVYRARTDLATAIGDYYQGRSCSPMAYQHDDNAPEALTRSVPAWVQGRVWPDCSLCSDNRALYVHWKPTIAYYWVGTADNNDQSSIIGGSLGSSTTRFKTPFASGLTPPTNSKSNWNGNILCDPNNNDNYERFAMTHLQDRITSANFDANANEGRELSSAIRDCVRLSNGCVYTPDPNLDTPVQTIASTCTAELKKDGTNSSQLFYGATQTTSMSDCLERSKDPNFEDSTSFCNSPNVKAALISMAGLSVNPAGLITTQNAVTARFTVTANWSLQQSVDSVGSNLTSGGTKTVGTCSISHSLNSGMVDIAGVNSSISRSIASNTSIDSIQGACTLSLGVPNASSATYTYLRSSDSDTIIDSTSTDAKCWKALGFTGVSSNDQAKANDTCSDLAKNSPKTLIAILDSSKGTLTSGSSAQTHAVQLKLLSKRYGSDGTNQICTLSRTTADWKTLFDSGQCYLQLESLVGGADPQKLPLVFTPSASTGGEAACLAQVNTASTCARITSIPAYLPYSPGGVRVMGYYANKLIRNAVNCAGNYLTTVRSGANLQFDNSCGLKADLSISSKGISQANVFSEKAIKLPTSTALANNNACHTYWQSSIQIPAVQNSQQAFCQRKIGSVYTALKNLSSSPLPSTAYFNGTTVTSYDFSGNNPLPSSGSTLPVSVQYSSYFSASPSAPFASETVCQYGLRKVTAPTFWPEWELYTPNGQEVLEKTCIRENITVATGGDDAPKCKTLTPGQTMVVGGAGPAHLADAATDTFSTQTKAALCARFLPAMNPISDLVQPDASKRLPLWILHVDAKGNVSLPVETATPSSVQNEALYCSPSTCQMTASYAGMSTPVDTSFLQNYGIMSTSAAECLSNHQSAMESVCATFARDPLAPDNVSINLTSNYGTQSTFLKTCDRPAENVKQCMVGFKGVPGVDFYPVVIKPQGPTMALSLTRHSGVFGQYNTKESCVAFTDGPDYCASENPFIHDANHPGEPYRVYRRFGFDEEVIANCYSALNFTAVSREPGQGILLTWSDLNPTSDATFDIQFCKGTGCYPGSQGLPDHDQISVSSTYGHTHTFMVQAGETYSFRMRMQIPGNASRSAVVLPWTWVATATAAPYGDSDGVHNPIDPLPVNPIDLLPLNTVDPLKPKLQPVIVIAKPVTITDILVAEPNALASGMAEVLKARGKTTAPSQLKVQQEISPEQPSGSISNPNNLKEGNPNEEPKSN